MERERERRVGIFNTQFPSKVSPKLRWNGFCVQLAARIPSLAKHGSHTAVLDIQNEKEGREVRELSDILFP